MKKYLAIVLAGITFLTGCQYVDGYLVHDAKSNDVYQQAVAYGVLRGYTVKYEDRANGLLAFKTGDEVYSGESKTTEVVSSQYNNSSNKDFQYEGIEPGKDNNRDKEKHEENKQLDKVVKDVSATNVKTKVSQTTTTPTRIVEKGVAMQFSQKGRDVEVKIRTFGSSYGGGEIQQVLDHFKDKWTVETIYKED